MFRGISTINLDAKGRMVMPVRYRDQLLQQCDGHLVITVHITQRCLSLYPLTQWETLERKVTSLPSFEPMTERLQHLLLGHANDLEMDSSGRVLLPQELRLYAELEKHVCLIGQGKKLEIWDQNSWAQQRESWISDPGVYGEMPEALRNLAL